MAYTDGAKNESEQRLTEVTRWARVAWAKTHRRSIPYIYISKSSDGVGRFMTASDRDADDRNSIEFRLQFDRIIVASDAIAGGANWPYFDRDPIRVGV